MPHLMSNRERLMALCLIAMAILFHWIGEQFCQGIDCGILPMWMNWLSVVVLQLVGIYLIFFDEKKYGWWLLGGIVIVTMGQASVIFKY